MDVSLALCLHHSLPAIIFFALRLLPRHFPHWSQLSNQNYMKFDSDFLMQAVCFYLSDLSWTILKCITCMRFKCDKSHRYQRRFQAYLVERILFLFADLSCIDIRRDPLSTIFTRKQKQIFVLSNVSWDIEWCVGFLFCFHWRISTINALKTELLKETWEKRDMTKSWIHCMVMNVFRLFPLLSSTFLLLLLHNSNWIELCALPFVTKQGCLML